ncbi:MAG: type VI secretion system protein TssR domain-containing protein [Bacteroidota bacterium]
MNSKINPSVAICLFFFALAALTPLHAQKKVLGMPSAFTLPFDEGTINQGDHNSKYDREIPWIVISDRANNTVYSSPNETSSQKEPLQFAEYFYVTQERDDWVEVATAKYVALNKLKSDDNLEIRGWVPKKHLLLWNTGLLDPRTKIHRKAFLLNKAQDINRVLGMDNVSVVDVFNSPNNNDKQEDRKIYEFYFVYKKEGNRFLLCTEDRLSPYNIKPSNLIGWVNSNRITQWNTRFCLEPNFQEAAFNERKTNSNYRVRAFDRVENARGYGSGQPLNNQTVVWENDPVRVGQDKLVDRRFKGGVLRFPMFNYSSGAIPVYTTGIIGTIKVKGEGGRVESIPDDAIVLLQDQLNRQIQRNENINLYFVIEASDQVSGYKTSIADAIRAISQLPAVKDVPIMRYGALIYRDTPEEKGGRTLVEQVELTRNIDQVTGFIQNANFINEVDSDPYTSMYYGIDQAMQVAGFSKNHVNIVINVGKYGDYKADRNRRTLAQQSGDKTYYETLDPIFKQIQDFDIEIHSLQLGNEPNRQSVAFAKQAQLIILESAKSLYSKTYGNSGLFPAPSMQDPEEQSLVELNNGVTKASILRPAQNAQMGAEQLKTHLIKVVTESINFNKELQLVWEDIVKGEDFDISGSEDNPSSGIFGPAVYRALDGVDPELIQKSLKEKYRLYTEAYLPAKVQGAAHPAISYSLFMPSEDLIRYQTIISNAISVMQTAESKRQGLFDIYKELVYVFSGNRPDFNKLSRSDVLKMMQGIEGEGIELPNFQNDIKIADIKDEKIVSNQQVEFLIQDFINVNQKLESILRLNKRYDFCFISENKRQYYWIPLDDAF